MTPFHRREAGTQRDWFEAAQSHRLRPREKQESVPLSLLLFTVAHTPGSQRCAHYLCMKPWTSSPGVASRDTFRATQESHSVS